LKRELSFSVGCLCELALLVLALVWGWLSHRSALTNLHWSLNSTLIGVVAAIPPFIFFLWTLKSKLVVFARHRHLMESLVLPIFQRWSIFQLAIISVLAGISEEAFFRGAIQGSLAGPLGVSGALVLASLLFAAAHPITWTYAIIVALIGAYLGLLWIWTGNLLTPMVTHAVYDFAALVYFLRVCRSS
jgi:membrane protease YdiL (CAAX protease family)